MQPSDKNKIAHAFSRTFFMPHIADTDQLLNQDEIDFFTHNGFLVKESLLDDNQVDSAMHLVWNHLIETVPIKGGAEKQLSRDDHSSWLNPQWKKMPDHPTSGPFQGRQPREYYPNGIVKLHDIGSHPLLVDLVPNNPRVRAIAERMLGKKLRKSSRTRGVYAVFPTTPSRKDGQSKLGPHTDQVCQQLNACAYLENVTERTGGFTIYPGSHKKIFHQHRFQSNWSPTSSYQETVQQIAKETIPFEVCAPKGSVIFWHGRLVHSVGIHNTKNIRWALFADFTHEKPTLADSEHRKLLQYEWFKDTKLFTQDSRVSQNMWKDWAIGPK
ncbi:MAG: hypothetical protein CMQ36_11105 [Gammaproteobacteria bacterium]|jgi:hypothetical protein|nr:hypothetical protein [Gammaproteobacteria bacterium]MCH2351622.1 phytanoyl-CoA dioxygenase family protein [Pseudomonadales bacterium]HAO55262.1 hypothetical protein [Gammaproteobacteria bacterium]|tara:strand:+ start:1415 stop:2395 length:981 start_codon:yes stop_codon:yes gene_type:complete